MEGSTATVHRGYGLGPHGAAPAHGAPPADEPRQAAQGPPGAPRPEEQHQKPHKPFFYIQPSHPYLPVQGLQWPVHMPVPVAYNPYYGYPGLGYGMPVMPHYPAGPYMEPPGFVVPHTHLHLMDYRRLLNSQYYQSMAYHARRCRYQHSAPSRDVTSSEAQTEPLPAPQNMGSPARGQGDAPGAPGKEALAGRRRLAPAAAQPSDQSEELQDAASSSGSRTTSNGSFVIQTEEVRIECCNTPVGLQLLRSHETAEVSHSFSQDVVRCSSVIHGGVLQDRPVRLPEDQTESPPRARPDILLVGTHAGGDGSPEPERPKDHVDPPAVSFRSSSPVIARGEGEEIKEKRPIKDFQLKVVHLPFDPDYLEELQKMESSVWSVEDSFIQRNLSDEALRAVPSVDTLVPREEAAEEEEVPSIDMPPFLVDEMEHLVPDVEVPGEDRRSEADVCLAMEVSDTTEGPAPELKHQTEFSASCLPENFSQGTDGNQLRREARDHQDTSFESLPAYLPSNSWLTDPDNVYYRCKTPLSPAAPRKPLGKQGSEAASRRRKLDPECKEQASARRLRERYKAKGKPERRSLSDHECRAGENAFGPAASAGGRLCTGCWSKLGICSSSGSGLLKRKPAPFQEWNDPLLPTCDACKSHAKKRMLTKASAARVPAPRPRRDTEGESSENGSCRSGHKRRAPGDPGTPRDPAGPLASKQNTETCPAAALSKNCLCGKRQQPAGRDGLSHGHHGNAIRETDENCSLPVSFQDKWRNLDRIHLTQRWHSEKSWRAVVSNHDSESSKSECRASHFNNHKMSQSQGTHRKDTRC